MRAKQISTAKLLDVTCTPALKKPAVADSASVYESTCKAARANGISDYMTGVTAGKAFRQAMSLLIG